MKIVLFGDSMFARFNSILIKQLESKVSQSDVYNCAAGGWDSNDGVRKSSYIASLKPDAVIISLGTNDAAAWKQVPLDTYKSNLDSIIESFSGSEIIFFPPPPVDESKQNKEFSRTNSLMRQYFDATTEVCKNRAVKFINSWAIFHPLLEQGHEYHIDDGVHFNDYGTDLLITHLVEMLRSGGNGD